MYLIRPTITRSAVTKGGGGIFKADLIVTVNEYQRHM